MATFRVVFADVPSPKYLQWLQQELPSDFRLVVPRSSDEGELIALVKDADFLITRKRVISREVILAGARLQLIQRYGLTGMNVDLEAARAASVPVAGIRQAGCVAVAELGMCLLLALSKNLLRAHQSTTQGKYRDLGLVPRVTDQRTFAFQWMQLPVIEVYGRVLGIVGLGEIGLEMARRAQAFDMSVLYYKRHRLPEEREREWQVCYCPLEDLLRASDYVSLNVPHTEETSHLIGKRELGLMKSSAFLINTCRGAVVDEKALVEALVSRSIAGAGLDVFEEEPVPFDSPLCGLDNIILVPHIGGGSGDPNLLQEIHEAYVNLGRVAHGEKPHHLF